MKAEIVMKACAARFSDHPEIVGPGAPKLAEVRQSPGRDFSAYGIARESFARSMAERALRAVDKKGLLRRPSADSTASLLMLEFLVTCEWKFFSIAL